MSMPDLKGQVAVVTGASRGVGKGIALGLGEAGATVVITGRSIQDSGGDRPGTIHATAEEVTQIGGKGIAMRCDHGNDEEVVALFEKVQAELGRIDILVNNAFSVPDRPIFDGKFWDYPIGLWDQLMHVGCRGQYVCSHTVAPVMVRQGRGLVVNVSSFAGMSYVFNVAYGVGKAATDRMAKDMAVELKPHGVTAVSLWPGVVRTEYLIEAAKRGEVPFGLQHGESPQLSGRAVAHFAADPRREDRTGNVLIVADLAKEYGFTDVDGRQPGGILEQMRQ
jgi:dehydrogenase/reductase SDR family protein 1